MNTTKTYGETQVAAARLVKSGSIVSGVASLIAVVITLMAMGNIWTGVLIPLAVIALGVAFLSQGGTIAARFSDLLPETSKRRSEVSKMGAGLSVEVAGGLIAGILGILALLNIMPSVLVPVAILVFGITMIFGSGVVLWLDSLLTGRSGEYAGASSTAHEAVMASGGLQFVLGMAAFILGILSLTGVAPLLMNHIGLLSVGFSELIAGSVISARMWTYAPHAASA